MGKHSARSIIPLFVLLLALATACSSGGTKASADASETSSTGSSGGQAASTSSASSSKTSGSLPSDVCGLLTDADLAAVVTGTPKTTPQNQGGQGITNHGCSWVTDTDTLTVTLISGIPAGQATLSIETEAKDNNGHDVDGVGDIAKEWTTTAATELQAMKGDVFLDVEIISLGNEPKDAAIASVATKIASQIS
jgi:hypothetical protein